MRQEADLKKNNQGRIEGAQAQPGDFSGISSSLPSSRFWNYSFVTYHDQNQISAIVLYTFWDLRLSTTYQIVHYFYHTQSYYYRFLTVQQSLGLTWAVEICRKNWPDCRQDMRQALRLRLSVEATTLMLWWKTCVGNRQQFKRLWDQNLTLAANCCASCERGPQACRFPHINPAQVACETAGTCVGMRRVVLLQMIDNEMNLFCWNPLVSWMTTQKS